MKIITYEILRAYMNPQHVLHRFLSNYKEPDFLLDLSAVQFQKKGTSFHVIKILDCNGNEIQDNYECIFFTTIRETIRSIIDLINCKIFLNEFPHPDWIFFNKMFLCDYDRSKSTFYFSTMDLAEKMDFNIFLDEEDNPIVIEPDIDWGRLEHSFE